MSSAIHRYRTHGFTIESAFELPELAPFAGAPDVFIRFGHVPETLEEPVARGPGYQASPRHYLLNMSRVARYLVTDGRDVLIAPAPEAVDDDVRAFLLSPVLGALAHQRGRFVMHGSAIAIDGRGVLLGGVSGAGKSTLAAALHGRGHTVLADDIVVIDFDDEGYPIVQPGYRHLRLWADALEHVGESLGARRRLRAGLQKYSVSVPGAPPRRPLPLSRVFVIARCPADSIEVHAATGRGKINALVRETHRRPTMTALDQGAACFDRCLAVARHVPVVHVHCPHKLGEIERIADAIEDDIRAASGGAA